MKKSFKRILAFALCLALCMSMLPASVLAGYGTLSSDNKTIQNESVSEVAASSDKVTTEWGDIPENWHGFVMRYSYDETSKIITVDTGLFQVPYSSAYSSYLKYDATKLSLLDNNKDDAGWADMDNNVAISDLTEALLTAGGSSRVNTIMGNAKNRVAMGGTYSLFNLSSDTSVIDYDAGDVNVTFTLKLANTLTSGAKIENDYKNFLDTNRTNVSFASYKGIMPLYSVSFGLKDGVTIDQIDYQTFKWGTNESIEEAFKGGNCTNSSGTVVAKGVYQLGFPEAPETKYETELTITGKPAGSSTASVKISGATVHITGTSARGNAVDVTTDPTDSEGKVTVQLPASNSAGYQAWVSDAIVGGKTYVMNASHKVPGRNLKVSAEDESTRKWSYAEMEEQTASYPVKITVQDQAGSAVDLSGATLGFGAYSVKASEITGNTASFDISSTGGQALTLSGIQGYQNIVSGTATINVTATSNNAATLSVGDVTRAAATISVVDNGIVVKLKKTTTNVIIPMPAPEGGVDEATAKEMTAAFTPVKDSANTDVPTTGMTTAPGSVTVNGDGSLRISADLPDGAYDMVVSGPGLQPTNATVTVITTYDESGNPTRVVNVGGTPQLDGDGNVTGVKDGVTGVTTNPSDETTGNGKVDLSGSGTSTEIYDGGDVTVTPGTGGSSTVTPPADDKKLPEGDGLQDTNTGSNLKPGVDTDPMYYIDVTPTMRAGDTMYDYFTAEVYLQNAKAGSGTFGMYFDPKLFGTGAGGTVTTTTVDLESIIEYAPSTPTSMAASEIRTNHQGNGYVFFNWQVPTNGAEINAMNGQVKLATIKLPVTAAYQGKADLEAALDQRSIYTMDYALTESGQDIANQVRNQVGANEEADPEGVQSAINDALSSIWRTIDNKGAYGSSKHTQLPDDRATRDGFYQYYAEGTAYDEKDNVIETGYNVPHDIKMKFNLPEIFKKQRVDFWVSNPNVGVSGAKIYITTDKTLLGSITDATADSDIPEGVTLLTTDQNGYAHLAQEVGDTEYFYKVLEKSHWAYPSGTSNTDSNRVIDSYLVTANGGSPNSDVYPAGGGTFSKTPVTNDSINPRMNPKTFHEVELLADTGTLEATITSSTVAYNNVTYYFSIAPTAGHAFTKAMAQMITDGDLTATLYTADNTKTTLEDAFRKLDPATLNIYWSPERQMFYINSDDVGGEGIGAGVTIGTDTMDPLRAGDLILTLKENVVTTASYKITATTGKGGTVEYADADGETNQVYESDDFTASGTKATAGKKYPDGTTAQNFSLYESLKDGKTTSAKYTFTPGDDPNVTGAKCTIDKVFINGVEQVITEQQKKNGYSYQFLSVSGDQNIYVTFLDSKGDPLSDPYLTVSSGFNGTVNVTGQDPEGNALTPNKVNGGETVSYITKPGEGLTLAIKPDNGDGADTGATKFVIDSIQVDGKDYPLTGVSTTDGSLTLTFPNTTDPDNTLDLNAGDTHSVVVTFKPEGQDSTHAIVTAKVIAGFGTISPVGSSIYPIGATPKYILIPDAGWGVLDEVEKNGVKQYSVQVDGVNKKGIDKAADGTLSFTMDPLTGDTALDITFFEDTVRVLGAIQLASTATSGATKAKLTFVRKAAGNTDDTKVELYSADGSVGSAQLSFDAELPVGVWELTVEKQGYVDYIITGFEVAAGDKHIHFGAAGCTKTGEVADCADTNVKPIPLTAGDAAGDGLTVAFNDASVVVAGWLQNATATNMRKGNIDENGTKSDSTDMSYVQKSMYKKRTKLSYDNFKTAVAGS